MLETRSTCPICQSPHRDTIDLQLALYRVTLYEVDQDALALHLREHMSSELLDAHMLSDVSAGEPTLRDMLTGDHWKRGRR